jgi:hypothetical protein
VKWKEVTIAEFGAISRKLPEGSERSYETFDETVGYPVRELKRENSEHENELLTDFTLRQMLTTQT